LRISILSAAAGEDDGERAYQGDARKGRCHASRGRESLVRRTVDQSESWPSAGVLGALTRRWPHWALGPRLHEFLVSATSQLLGEACANRRARIDAGRSSPGSLGEGSRISVLRMEEVMPFSEETIRARRCSPRALLRCANGVAFVMGCACVVLCTLLSCCETH